MKKYRNNGAIGALLDEYEKSIKELTEVIRDISHHQLVVIIDPKTNDNDCRSIQTILTHIIQSGYTYPIEIRKWLGEEIEYKKKTPLHSINEYNIALKEMLNFNENLFVDYPNLQIEEHDIDKKIKARWGQQYDVEQLFEHAIVHVLRHRRQIEKFKRKTTEQSTIHNI